MQKSKILWLCMGYVLWWVWRCDTMIGKIYISMVEFYDVRNQKTSIKARPVLILSDMRNNDFTVLPISTISKTQNIDIEYDIELNPQIYQKMNLNKVSYIRTHKRIYLH